MIAARRPIASLAPPIAASANMSPPSSIWSPGTSTSVAELLDLLAVGGELLAGAVGEVDLGVRDVRPLRAIWRAPSAAYGLDDRRRRGSSARSRRTVPPSPAAPAGRRRPGSAWKTIWRLHLPVAEARLLEQVERGLALGAGQLELGLERAVQAARRARRCATSRTIQPPSTQRRRRYMERASRCSMGGDLTLSGGSVQASGRASAVESLAAVGTGEFMAEAESLSSGRRWRTSRSTASTGRSASAELVGQDHVHRAAQRRARRPGRARLPVLGPAGHGQDHDRPAARQGAELHESRRRRRSRAACARAASPSPTARSLDVFEVDAASNSRVDEMRDLLERVAYLSAGGAQEGVHPRRGAHAQRAAREAALLKTLEEPPEHVVFVLATTDPLKVAPTIRSRTQHYEFTLYTLDELVGAPRRRVRARKASRPIPKRWRSSPAPAPGRCATRSRCSTRPSRTARSTSSRSARCSAAPRSTGRARDPASDRRRRRRRRARRAGRAARRRARAAPAHRRPARDRRATRSCSRRRRGRVRVDAPEDDVERARRARRAGRARRARAHARDARPGRRRHARHRRRRSRASCSRSRSCAWPAARPGTPLQALAERVDRLERGAAPATAPARRHLRGTGRRRAAPVGPTPAGPRPRPRVAVGRSFAELKRDRTAGVGVERVSGAGEPIRETRAARARRRRRRPTAAPVRRGRPRRRDPGVGRRSSPSCRRRRGRRRRRRSRSRSTARHHVRRARAQLRRRGAAVQEGSRQRSAPRSPAGSAVRCGSSPSPHDGFDAAPGSDPARVAPAAIDEAAATTRTRSTSPSWSTRTARCRR